MKVRLSRRVRWWLVASAALALLLVVAGLAAWHIAARYGPVFTRERVAAALSRALARPVTVERVILQPWRGRVGLGGVRVAAGASWEAGTMLAARRVLATVGISSLWRREVVISRVLVEDVDLALALGDDGAGRPSAFPLAIPDRVEAGPVTVAVGALEVRRARVRLSGDGMSVDVEGLEGRARPRGGGLDLTARADRVGIAAAALAGRFDAVQAAGRLAGDRLVIERLDLAWLGEPLTARGELSELGGATRVDAKVTGRIPVGPVAQRARSPWAMDGVASVQARVDGPLGRPLVEGRLTIPALTAGPVTASRVEAGGAWRGDRLDLSDFAARTLGGTVTGSLSLEPAALDRTRLTVRAEGVDLAALDALLAPALGASPGVRGPVTIEGEAQGDLTRPATVRASARLEAPTLDTPGELARLGPAAVSGRLRFADGTIEVIEARGRWSAATVEAAGQIDTRGRLALRGSISGDLAQLAAAWAMTGLAGDVTVDVEATGPWDALTLRGVASAPSVAAHGTALRSVRVPFSATPRSVRVDRATATLGQTTVGVGGTARWTDPGAVDAARWRQALAVDATVDVPEARAVDLRPWLPGDWAIDGPFTLAARVRGTAESWTASGRLQSPRLDVRGQALERLQAEFAATPAGIEVRPLRLLVHGAPVAGHAAWRRDGSASATLDVGPLSLAAVPGVPARAALAGTARGRVEARLAAGALAADATLTVQEATAAGLALGDGTVRAAVRDNALTADLAFPGARLTASATGPLQPGQTLAVRAQVADVDAGMLAARLAPASGNAYARIDGRLSAVAEVAVPYSRPADAAGTVRIDPLRLTWAGESWSARGPVLLRRRPGVTVLERLELESRLGMFTADGSVGDDGGLALGVRGRLPLGVLAIVRPEVRSAAGLLDATVKLGGTFARPEVVGEGEITGGQIAMTAYPDTIRDVRARLQFSPRAVRVVEATAALAGGQLRASGEMAIDAGRPGAYRFAVTARDVAVAPLADLHTSWDADLELVGLATRAQLRGEARLLRGLYTRDISILRALLEGGPARERTAGTGSGLLLDLRVALQDNLVVRTTIARFRAGGTLTVAGTTDAPVVFGTVETREGQIVFRRQTFTLTSASARFIDPRRIDPVLDVRGTARIRDYDVTLHISGRSEDLEIRFTSSPALPEEDVLSLVAFGATREQIGRRGPGLVVGEVAGLLVQDLFGVQSTRAGVDVFELDTDPEAGTRTLRVGKRLTPRTLLVYSQDLEDTDSRRLRVEYQVFGPLRVAGEQDFRGGVGGEVLVRLRFR